jgi:5-methylthioadenosine/S-adenosylhomocysteine deaminase
MQQVDLIIAGACVVTMDEHRRVLPDGAVAIKDDRIAAIGGREDILGRFAGLRTIDAVGKYLYPGFISTHTHLFQSLLKGLGRDKPLFAWLDSSVRRAMRNFDAENIHYAALVGLIEAVRSGTTTILDYQYCHTLPGMDQSVIQAYLDLQVRGVFCRSHTNVARFPPEMALEYVETEDTYFREMESLCLKYRGHPLLDMAMAPGIIWDHDRSGYIKTRELADHFKIPISMHLVETEDDDAYSMKTWGMSSIDFLESCGMLGPDFLAVHCIHVTDDDIRRFRDYDVKISHCPVSNMILASGTAPVPRFLEEGLTVSLACDGAASNDTQDMLDVMRITALKHKLVRRDASVVSAEQVLEMATLGGAKAVGMEKRIGSLEVGKMADMFIWSADTARAIPVNDPISSLVYSSDSRNIETTIVGGKVILHKGKILSLDETAVLRKAQSLAEDLVRRSDISASHWGFRIPTACGLT